MRQSNNKLINQSLLKYRENHTNDLFQTKSSMLHTQT